MKCPICNDTVHVDYNLHSEGFSDGVMECGACGTIWSVIFGVTSIVRDRKGKSFSLDSFKAAAWNWSLPAQTKCAGAGFAPWLSKLNVRVRIWHLRLNPSPRFLDSRQHQQIHLKQIHVLPCSRHWLPHRSLPSQILRSHRSKRHSTQHPLFCSPIKVMYSALIFRWNDGMTQFPSGKAYGPNGIPTPSL